MMSFALSKLKRPRPPRKLLDVSAGDLFVPAEEVAIWGEEVFYAEGAPFAQYVPELASLQMADIGVLWTNVRCVRQARPVVGRIELVRPNPMHSDWAKAEYYAQIKGWFDRVPDYKMTLYAPFMAEADNATFCAVVLHELLHAWLKLITKKGKPIWGIQGHDVEEHVRVVELFGVGAAAGKTRELVEVAKRKPLIAPAQIDGVCGTKGCFKIAA